MLDVLESIAPLKIKCIGLGTILLFWVVAVYPFIAQRMGIYDTIATPLQLLADITVTIFGLWTIRSKWDWAVLISYILISGITTIFINHNSAVFWINGSRFYIGVIFMICIFRWIFARQNRAIYFIEKFDRSLYIFLWLQVPVIIFQYFALGGRDQGGGTLGNLMSPVISLLIYSISYYLVLKKWDNDKSFISNILSNKILIFLLFPTFLNETKISFIYLAMYFFFLVPFNKKFIRNILILLPIAVAIIIGAGYIYLNTSDLNSEERSLEYLEYYVMGDEQTYEIMESLMDNYGGEEDRDFMRGAKFLMLPAVLIDQPWGVWTGYGVSQYKGGNVMKKTEFYRKYEWYFFGTTTTAMMILVDMGIAGMLWWFFTVAVMFGWLGRQGRPKGSLQWFLGLNIFILLFYAANFIILPFTIIFIYLTTISCNWDKLQMAKKWEQEESDTDAIKEISVTLPNK